MKRILLFFAACSVQFCFAQKADLILTNGNIITMNNGSRCEAIAVKDGNILDAGTDTDLKALIGPQTRIIDLNKKTVIPGFNDVHQHPFPVYGWEKLYATLRLDTVASMKSLIALLKRKAAVTPKGMLIRGVGYNELKLGGQPIRDSLDLATTEHPVLITHASGHVCAVNSYMLNVNHISQSTQDPPGGALERYRNGIPDGIVKESARKLLSSPDIINSPHPTHAEELEGYRIYFRNMLAGGLTSVGDCWTTPDKVNIYRELVAEKFPIRLNLYIGVDYLDQVLNGAIKRETSDYLRIEGIKLVHGNSLSGKTCWLYNPYDTINPASGKKDYYGIAPARSQSSLDSLVLKIHRAGLQIACHSNGDREIDMVLTAIENAQQTLPGKNLRHRIEHCSITNTSILRRIKNDNIIPVFHCYINELGGQLMVYGKERLSMIMPTQSAIEMQIPFALHSDYPISRYEAMKRLSGAVNRMTMEGKVLGGNQRLKAEDAIFAYTSGGAYTSHEENKKGKLVKGEFADMIILDNDPTAVSPKDIEKIHITMTIVGGKIAYQEK